MQNNVSVVNSIGESIYIAGIKAYVYSYPKVARDVAKVLERPVKDAQVKMNESSTKRETVNGWIRVPIGMRYSLSHSESSSSAST